MIPMLAGVVALLAPSPASAQFPRTKEDLVRSWAVLDEWDRASRTYQVKQFNVLVPDKPPGLATLKARPDRWLISTVFRDIHSIFSRSPEYGFLLWKEPSNPSWVLRHYEGDPASEAASLFGHASGQYILIYPLSTFIGLAEENGPRDPSLAFLARQDAFVVKSIKPAEGNLTQVDFRYKSTSGSLVVDPNRSCVVVRSRLVGEKYSPTSKPWTLDLSGREFYPETSAGGVPRCKSIEFSIKGENGKVVRHERYEYGEYIDGETPDKEFRLSHYGLPEPRNVVAPSGTPKYVWLLLAAGILSVLALIFRRFARRGA